MAARRAAAAVAAAAAAAGEKSCCSKLKFLVLVWNIIQQFKLLLT